MLLLLSPYLLTNKLASLRAVTVWSPKDLFVLSDGTHLDHAIAFVDWSIFVYYTIFLFYAALPLVAPRTDLGRRDLLVTIQYVVLASWAAYLVFLLFPAEVDLREQAVDAGAQEGWLGSLYTIFHWLDRPYNSWPSLHVTQTFLAAAAMTRWWRAAGKSGKVVALWTLWAALAVSTLTTKQHFLWDALTGLALGAATWWFGLRPALRSNRPDLNAKEAKEN